MGRLAALALGLALVTGGIGACAPAATEEPTGPTTGGGSGGAPASSNKGGSGTPTATGGGVAPAATSGGAAGGPTGAGGAAGGAGAGSSPGGGGSTGSGGGPGSGGSPAGAATDGGVETAPPAADAGASVGLVKVFDGSGWDNWEYDPKAWMIKDGAMYGRTAGGQSQAFTKKDYSNFRLIVWSRMPGKDHLGICLWGGRPAAGRYGFEKCLLVIPPNGAIWDYLENKDYPKPGYQVGQADWHKTEILANRDTGKVLVAVNGKLVHEYQDAPDRLAKRKHGPVGVQIHKAGFEVEYKDIEIEADPKSDKLITLTP